MKVLAVDFGIKHVGLAISEGKLAEPFGELENNPQLVGKLKNICLKHSIEVIVLGLPEGKLTFLIKQLGQTLGKETHLRIVFQDETLTSEEARQKMMIMGKPQQKRKTSEHIIAACLILQDYLDLN
jgi:putative Holliday junction resolvase